MVQSNKTFMRLDSALSSEKVLRRQSIASLRSIYLQCINLGQFPPNFGNLCLVLAGNILRKGNSSLSKEEALGIITCALQHIPEQNPETRRLEIARARLQSSLPPLPPPLHSSNTERSLLINNEDARASLFIHPSIPCGIPTLDFLSPIWQKGQLSIILSEGPAAETLCTQFSVHAATDQKRLIGAFFLDFSRKALSDYVSRIGKWPMRKAPAHSRAVSQDSPQFRLTGQQLDYIRRAHHISTDSPEEHFLNSVRALIQIEKPDGISICSLEKFEKPEEIIKSLSDTAHFNNIPIVVSLQAEGSMEVQIPEGTSVFTLENTPDHPQLFFKSNLSLHRHAIPLVLDTERGIYFEQNE